MAKFRNTCGDKYFDFRPPGHNIFSRIVSKYQKQSKFAKNRVVATQKWPKTEKNGFFWKYRQFWQQIVAKARFWAIYWLSQILAKCSESWKYLEFELETDWT